MPVDRMGRLEERVTHLEILQAKSQARISTAEKAGRVVLALIGVGAAIAGAVAAFLHLR